jgi:chaperone required for assembly of F1-ATPase
MATGLAAGVAGAEPPAKGAGRMHHGQGGDMHAQMREQMQQHDARLDELVAAMNAAEGDAKVDAIAAVVNELVSQRRTRRAHMEQRWHKQQGGKPGTAAPDSE